MAKRCYKDAFLGLEHFAIYAKSILPPQVSERAAASIVVMLGTDPAESLAPFVYVQTNFADNRLYRAAKVRFKPGEPFDLVTATAYCLYRSDGEGTLTADDQSLIFRLHQRSITYFLDSRLRSDNWGGKCTIGSTSNVVWIEPAEMVVQPVGSNAQLRNSWVVRYMDAPAVVALYRECESPDGTIDDRKFEVFCNVLLEQEMQSRFSARARKWTITELNGPPAWGRLLWPVVVGLIVVLCLLTYDGEHLQQLWWVSGFYILVFGLLSLWNRAVAAVLRAGSSAFWTALVVILSAKSATSWISVLVSIVVVTDSIRRLANSSALRLPPKPKVMSVELFRALADPNPKTAIMFAIRSSPTMLGEFLRHSR